MSVILGVNSLHADSSACVVIDGTLRSAIAEERLGERLKHDPRYPGNAVRCVLAEAGVRYQDVTHVAVPGQPQSNYGAKIAYVLKRPRKAAGAVIEHLRRRGRMADVLGRLAETCGADPARCKAQIVRVEHHLAHIASSYYLSPFDGLTAGFSFDASGDFVSAMAARCQGTKIEVLDRVHLPHSLGFFYSAICQFIGFDDFGEEYKVMGLAAYGQDNYRDLMSKLLRLGNGAWFALNQPYFGMHDGGVSGGLDANKRFIVGKLYTQRLIDELGAPRLRTAEITKREEDLARSCQVRFEEAFMHCAQRLHDLVPSEQIAYSGGCALNGVANGRLLRETPFRKTYIQPASTDDGTSLGAAYWCWHNVVGGTQRYHMDQAFWGPQYSDDQHRTAAQSCAMPMKSYSDAALLPAVAKLLRAGLVVGWYQGRSEWGPRALGNRSILADPSRPDIKDAINLKIKRREKFRPFAPTVLASHVNEIFEQNIVSPFMMHVVKIRPQWQPKLPGVTHIDGTGRLQSIERHHNPRYYDLISEFHRQSGVPVVLNTSFNENEPIVDTPDQAVACFLRTDMDAICLGNHVVVKPAMADKLSK